MPEVDERQGEPEQTNPTGSEHPNYPGTERVKNRLVRRHRSVAIRTSKVGGGHREGKTKVGR